MHLVRLDLSGLDTEISYFKILHGLTSAQEATHVFMKVKYYHKHRFVVIYQEVEHMT